jgi:hypothetical protein
MLIKKVNSNGCKKRLANQIKIPRKMTNFDLGKKKLSSMPYLGQPSGLLI